MCYVIKEICTKGQTYITMTTNISVQVRTAEKAIMRIADIVVSTKNKMLSTNCNMDIHVNACNCMNGSGARFRQGITSPEIDLIG